MWLPKGSTRKKGARNGLVGVAIEGNKGSQHALKWAVDNLILKGQTVVLIHVLHKNSGQGNYCEVNDERHKQQLEKAKDLFVTFHCYCTRKEVHCLDITLEDNDIVKALTEYVSYAAIEHLVLGTSSKNSFIRRFKSDVPSSVSRCAPDFCSVYVISKGKVSSVRNASRPPPHSSPLQNEIEGQKTASSYEKFRATMSFKDRKLMNPTDKDKDTLQSSFPRDRGYGKALSEFSDPETDISFVSSSRPSSAGRSSFLIDYPDSAQTSRVSTSSDQSFGSLPLGVRFYESSPHQDFSPASAESARTSCSYSSQSTDDVEAEMRRLKLELKQTMELYSTACREAIAAKHQAMELQRWKIEEEKRLQEAKLSEEAKMSIFERERVKCKEAIEAAEAAKRIAEREAQRRVEAEMKALEGSSRSPSASASDGFTRYRKYTIEEIEAATDHFSETKKIGEGGYGPVFKCYLDHTPVAVKVLRPDAAQGRSQFQKEIEILSCIRHPNMVLLLGACPEYGIIVYEHMAKGSLADQLHGKGNTAPLSWQLRFRIAAEIATALLFLHQTKPEPLVHRDLKPGNILLDQNYVSKISDVGLARLVPAVADQVVTSAAGTFCYIDPEYQQTGMLGVKSDVYSFGILLLEILTAKKPMGLTYCVREAIDNGTFSEMLDSAVPDWPLEEALSLAKIALQCAELRRKDRPDLGKVVLPELERLRDLAEENIGNVPLGVKAGPSPSPSQTSFPPDVMSDPMAANSECSKTQSSTSSESTDQKQSDVC